MYWSFLPLVLICSSFEGQSVDSNSFEWGTSKSELNSLKKLKERWAFSLLQECIRSKVENEFIDLGIPYEIQVEEGLLPCHFNGFFLAEEKNKIAILEKIKEGKNVDFSEEFSVVKNLWKKWIQKEKKTSFYPQWINEFSFSPYYSYFEFIGFSEEILQDLQLEDLMVVFSGKKESPIENFLETNSSYSFRKDLASHSSGLSSDKKGWEPTADSIKIGEPKSEESKRFFDLPVTEEEKSIIRKIITTMADKNVIQLLLEKKSMERKGDKIQPVHPLRFAGIVLTDPNLKRCMKLITKSTFKWNGFLDGYEKRMKEEARAGTLMCYAAGLADLLEVDRFVIMSYLNQGNYGGLIKHFL